MALESTTSMAPTQDQTSPELEHGPDEDRYFDDEQSEEQQIDEQDLDEPPLDAHQLEENLSRDREALRKALHDLEAAEARVKRNAERVYDESRASLVHHLFPVLDNLDRSIAAAEANSDPALLEGVRLIRKQLDDVLVRYGAERIDAMGGPFDPTVQEAVTTVNVSDPTKNFTVIEQLAPGYRFGDRLLRPARVVVGLYPR
jgi:molecular chaperone GrpE (heat shock protein)